ncbi:phosphotransferase family protein [Paenibacillus gorillae]|uniref:phosphotransferase family protein n=1 Tax=Paenibacillus gorillae TaxID=1243662 RepID=UPI0004B9D656|nr:aminoglycoside phosphotransferase family protein [Paenibacillus gorillae]
MGLGELLGKGMTAEVYAWENGLVVKLYLAGIPSDWAGYEWKIARSIVDAGVPAPVAYELVELEARTGIVYERLIGHSLLNELLSDLTGAEQVVREMAELHAAIHRCKASSDSDLPRQAERLEREIRESRDVLQGREEELVEVLGELEAASLNGYVCHGDLHPDNIIRTAEGLRAIDWMNASSGAPHCDIARTSLMFLSPYLPDGSPFGSQEHIMAFKKQMNGVYLEHYGSIMEVDQVMIEKWFIPVAAARLRENVPGEQQWLLSIIDKFLAERNTGQHL